MTQVLKATHDRKTRFRPNHKNTFGLYPGPEGLGTCPFATTGAGGCYAKLPGRILPTCYVFKLMHAFPGVEDVLTHNTELLRNADYTEKVKLLTTEFERFKRAELSRKDPKLYYRLHWSGDMYDEEYTHALADAMRRFPEIQFWNYTRTLDMGAYLARNVPNLVQYISLDPPGLESGLDFYYRHKSDDCPLKLAYMSRKNDWAERYRALHKDHPSWPADPPVLLPCPADDNQIPLENACSVCLRCLNGHGIWFKTR